MGSCELFTPELWKTDDSPVLPPISTVGKTTEDVPELVEETRDAMLQALREISTPTSTPITSPSLAPGPLLQGKQVKSYAAVAATKPPEEDEIDESAISEETPLRGAMVGADTGRTSNGGKGGGTKKKLAIA